MSRLHSHIFKILETIKFPPLIFHEYYLKKVSRPELLTRPSPLSPFTLTENI